MSGRIVDETGAPLPASRLELHPALSSYDELSRALLDTPAPEAVAHGRTDGGGFFTLAAPREGFWRLIVEAPGHTAAEVPLAPLLESTELPALTLTRSREIAVRLRSSSDQPVVSGLVLLLASYGSRNGLGAWGWVARSGLQVAERFFRADDTGRVSISLPAEGPARLRAAAPGFAPISETAVGGAIDLQLVPAPLRRLEVRQPDGEPAAAALAVDASNLIPLGRSDEQGRLDIAWPKGEQGVRVLDRRGFAATLEPTSAEPAAEISPLTLERPHELAGTLRDDDGNPIADGWIWQYAEEPLAARSDARGRWRLAVPVGIERVRLLAAARDHRPERAVVWREGSATSGIELRLRRARTLAGRTVDTDGAPVADVAIEVLPPPRSFESTSFARSRADGRFVLRGLHRDAPVELRATKEGFSPWEGEVDDAASRGVEIVLPPSRGVVGWVMDLDEAPIAGALVLLGQSRPAAHFNGILDRSRAGGAALETTAEEDGRFELRDVPPGPVDLAAEAPGYAPLRATGVAVPEGGGMHEVGTLYLEPGAVIAGRVVDADGTPIAGAAVDARLDRSGTGGFLRRQRQRDLGAVSAADGSFEIVDLEREVPVYLAVDADGYGGATVAVPVVPPAEPLEIRLEDAARVAGVVVDADESPVPDAMVQASLRRDGSGRVGSVARSDSDGAFALDDLRSGTWDLHVRATGYREAPPTVLELAAGERRSNLRLVLEKGAELSGTVRDENGEPIARASLWLEPTGAGGRSSRFVRRTGDNTDAAGRFQVSGAPVGPVEVTAGARGFRELRQAVELRAGENSLDLVLEKGGEVEGVVVDDQGRGVGGAQVGIAPAHSPAWSSRRFVGGEPTYSDAAGRFRLGGLEPGSYRVSAQREGYATGNSEPFTVADAPVSGIEVRLEAGVSLLGTILGLDDQQLARAEVSLWRQEPGAVERLFAQPDHSGRFLVEHLQPGAYSLTVSAPRRRKSVQVEVLADQANEVEIRFEEGWRLSGVVLRNGAPEPNLRVQMDSRAGPGMPSQHAQTVTDHQGRFVVEDLETGSHSLVLISDSGMEQQEMVPMDGDREITIELRSAAVRGRVVDESTGEPVGGAAVSLLVRTGSGPVSSRFDGPLSGPDGRFVVLAKESLYVLSVTAEGFESVARDIDLRSGDVELEIRLRPSEGRWLEVRLPGGEAPSYLFWAALDGSGRPLAAASARVDSRGRVRIPSLPPHVARVCAATLGYPTSCVAPVADGQVAPVQLAIPVRVRVHVPAISDSSSPGYLMARGTNGQPYVSLLGGTPTIGVPVIGWTELVLPPGRWVLEVSVAGGTALTKTVDVAPGMGEVVLE